MQIVPQYIDIEDKIAGPLTWKHIGWLFGGGAILSFLFVTLDRITFMIIAIPFGLLVIAMAFYRPQGVPLVEFMGYGFSYIFKPKRYLWSRDFEAGNQQSDKIVESVVNVKQKEKMTMDEITAISQTLDSGGVQRNKQMQELIKKNISTANKK
ncbi:MAG: PrgI family protein [Candidatus Moraniibacteriota bacterium]|jgi:PrgI family protein